MSTSRYDTMNSMMSNDLDKGVLEDLSKLTLIVEDFGQDPDSDFANQLVEIGRKVLYAGDVTVRLGGTSEKPMEGKLYVFNDLLVLGKYKRSKRKGAKSTLKGKTQDKIMFGDNFDTQDALNASEILSQVDDGLSTLRAREGSQLKLKLWVNLDRSGLQVRNVEKMDMSGIKIIFTTKEIEEVDGETEVITNVDQTELFFESPKNRALFSEHIIDAIDGILERQMADIDDISQFGSMKTLSKIGGSLRTGSVGASFEAVIPVESEAGDDARTMRSKSVGTTGSGRRRRHMNGLKTLKESKKARNRGKRAPMTLEDLESRYKFKFKPKENQDMAEFNVVFKPGPLGFALIATGSNGVFVARLEENGMADASGVTLGDRVIEIGGEKIANDAKMEECTGLIKKKKQELDENGKPKSLKIKFARRKDIEENVAKVKEEEKKREIKERLKKRRERRGGKRAWHTKRKQNKSYGTRVKSLHDLKNKYTKRGINEEKQLKCDDILESVINNSGDKNEKRCAYILQEIYQTEKKYVGDLYLLNDHFIKNLLRKKVPMTCKEYALISNSKFCEHNLVAKNCNQFSTRKKDLMSPEDFKVLFGNIKVITKLNEELLDRIQKGLIKLSKNTENEKDIKVTNLVQVFSPAFTQLMPFYAMYSQYAARYPKMIDKLNNLGQNDHFKQFIIELEGKKEVKSLRSLLFAPITRLTKYPLLFQTLTKAIEPYVSGLTTKIINGEKGDIDELTNLVDSLSKTNEIVNKVAATVDLKVDENAKMDELSQVYDELGGVQYIKEFHKPSRRFLHRFENVSVVENLNKRGKQRKNKVILLFNDMVIVGGYTRKGGKLKKTLTNSDRSSVREYGKKSTISKNDSMKNSNKTKRGMFGFRSRNQPLIKIEYMSEMKHVRVVNTPGQDDQFMVQCFLTSKPRIDDDEKSKTKKKNLMDTKPSVVQLEFFLASLEQKKLLVNMFNKQKDEVKDMENKRRIAKQALSGARGQLRGRKKLLEKAKRAGNTKATLSSNRQADLRRKLEERRKLKNGG